MNIIVRNIDAAAIAKIDQIAKRKRMSREALLRSQIESFAISAEIVALENRYGKLVEQLTDIVKENTELLKECRQLINTGGDK